MFRKAIIIIGHFLAAKGATINRFGLKIVDNMNKKKTNIDHQTKLLQNHNEILIEPKNDKEKEDCKKAQEYLSSEWDQWPLPSIVELKDEIALVWYIYKDVWPYTDEPDFSYFIVVPAYIFWGKKKRDKYLKERG